MERHNLELGSTIRDFETLLLQNVRRKLPLPVSLGQDAAHASKIKLSSTGDASKTGDKIIVLKPAGGNAAVATAGKVKEASGSVPDADSAPGQALEASSASENEGQDGSERSQIAKMHAKLVQENKAIGILLRSRSAAVERLISFAPDSPESIHFNRSVQMIQGFENGVASLKGILYSSNRSKHLWRRAQNLCLSGIIYNTKFSSVPYGAKVGETTRFSFIFTSARPLPMPARVVNQKMSSIDFSPLFNSEKQYVNFHGRSMNFSFDPSENAGKSLFPEIIQKAPSTSLFGDLSGKNSSYGSFNANDSAGEDISGSGAGRAYFNSLQDPNHKPPPPFRNSKIHVITERYPPQASANSRQFSGHLAPLKVAFLSGEKMIDIQTSLLDLPESEKNSIMDSDIFSESKPVPITKSPAIIFTSALNQRTILGSAAKLSKAASQESADIGNDPAAPVFSTRYSREFEENLASEFGENHNENSVLVGHLAIPCSHKPSHCFSQIVLSLPISNVLWTRLASACTPRISVVDGMFQFNREFVQVLHAVFGE